MCIQTGKTEADPDRMKFEKDEMYIKSTEEMEALFSKYPGAIENTRQGSKTAQKIGRTSWGLPQ